MCFSVADRRRGGVGGDPQMVLIEVIISWAPVANQTNRTNPANLHIIDARIEAADAFTSEHHELYLLNCYSLLVIGC